MPNPQNTRPANEPPLPPATSTSAHAVPSGNVRLPCSFTISCRRSGIINSTPSHPPSSASKNTREYSSGNPIKISAGKVKITPEATDSPADPIVCTMLFSRMVDLPNARSTVMDSTAMGIEAETVSPARNPTYTVTAPNSTPNSIPKTIVFSVNSASDCSGPTYGRKSLPVAVGLQDFDATRHPHPRHVGALLAAPSRRCLGPNHGTAPSICPLS